MVGFSRTSIELDAGNTIEVDGQSFTFNSSGELLNPDGNKLIDLAEIDSDEDGTVDAADLAAAAESASGDFDLSGNSLTDSTRDFVEVATGNDLRLATGQAIEDGSGTDRFSVGSTFTVLRDDTGNIAFESRSGDGTDIRTYSNQPFRIDDEEGSFTAVQYDTDPRAGVLRTPNAGVRVESTGNATSGKGVELAYSAEFDIGTVSARDRTNSEFETIKLRGNDVVIDGLGGLIDMSQQPANLRLATGQAIEDGSGNSRVDLSSVGTLVQAESDNSAPRLDVREDNGVRARVKSGSSFNIYDAESSTVGVQYLPDSSVGTLELTNANLDMAGQDVTGVGSLSTVEATADQLSYAPQHFVTGEGGSNLVGGKTAIPINRASGMGWVEVMRFDFEGYKSSALSILTNYLVTPNNSSGGDISELDGYYQESNVDSEWGSAGSTTDLSDNVRTRVGSDTTSLFLEVNRPDGNETGILDVSWGGRGFDATLTYDDL